MNSVTYFLGAGASYNALPLVSKSENSKGFHTEIVEFLYVLEARSKVIRGLGDDVYKWLQRSIDLIKGVENHMTIDTFARKLKLLDDQVRYKHLKHVISFYLSYKQLYEKPDASEKSFRIDERYIGLLAGILEKDPKEMFPKVDGKINFINWNYDCQLELAFMNFSSSKLKFDGLLNACKSYPGRITDIADSKIIHLNGICGTINKKNGLNFLMNFTEETEREYLIQVLPVLAHPRIGNSEIHFAWDKTDVSVNAITRSIEITRNSEYLVIIGYSFPFFNRGVDRKILNKENLSNIKKIYIQNPSVDIEAFISQFQLEDLKERIFKVASTSEGLRAFFIPPEL